MKTYKINLHAHTIFSDGHNSPLGMAMEAKELGFSALVITDHFYGNGPLWCSLNRERWSLLRRACTEAKEILPVILGIELSFGREEILVFGGGVIQDIMDSAADNKVITLDMLTYWKHKYSSAFILCHPGSIANWEYLRPILDGYEAFNSGQDYFKDGRDLGALEGLPGWCNSDAHSTASLAKAYNIVNMKIEEEKDLIKCIRKGYQPTPYLRNKE